MPEAFAAHAGVTFVSVGPQIMVSTPAVANGTANVLRYMVDTPKATTNISLSQLKSFTHRIEEQTKR